MHCYRTVNRAATQRGGRPGRWNPGWRQSPHLFFLSCFDICEIPTFTLIVSFHGLSEVGKSLSAEVLFTNCYRSSKYNAFFYYHFLLKTTVLNWWYKKGNKIHNACQKTIYLNPLTLWHRLSVSRELLQAREVRNSEPWIQPDFPKETMLKSL